MSLDEQRVADLRGLIYDAAIQPDLWAGALERFADLIGGHSVWLSQLSIEDGRGGGVIARIDPTMPDVYQAHYRMINPLHNVSDPKEYLRTWKPRILTDEDWMPKEELLKSEYYNDFMRPQNMHAVLIVRLAIRGPDVFAVSITRPETHGRFSQSGIALAEKLQSTLLRGFRLTQELGSLRQMDKGLALALDNCRDAIFVLDQGGQVRHANRAAEALIAERIGLAVIEGRLVCEKGQTAAQLDALIAAAAARDPRERKGGTTAIWSPKRTLPITATVAPAGAEPFALFTQGAAVVVSLSDPGRPIAVSEDLLRSLFGLTSAEARAVAALASGLTPAEAAARLGIALNTMRVHLRRAFEKTGTGRQSELLQLVMRTAAIR